MKIAIVGAGAVGCWYAALLARAGHDVTLQARGATLAALQARPLRVRSAVFGEADVAVRAVADPSEAAPVELVLLAVKSQGVASTLPSLAGWLGPETPVITLQNGVDAPAQVAAHLGPERAVWPGCVYLLASALTPGEVDQSAGPNRLVFGDPSGREPARATAIAEVIRAAGVDAMATPTILTSLWEKFGIIAGWNGVLSVARQPIGVVFADPVMLAFLRDVIDESHAVGRARGIPLAADLTDKQLAFMAGFAPGAYGSMATDLFAGRPLELEALNGAVVRLGREAGVPTPYNAAIYAALRPYVNGPPATGRPA